MKLLLTFLAVAVAVCLGATYNNAGGQRCRRPDWKCNCKLVYDCDGNTDFPAEVGADAALSGYIKDLAPTDYPLEMPGKRWRRNRYQQADYCQRECTDRMNAHLCIDKDSGSFTDYSYSAVCLKLLENASPSGPFSQDGVGEPCCTIHLEYSRAWCTPALSKEVGHVRCLALPLDNTFNTETGDDVVSHVFSAEGGCAPTNAAEGSFAWCTTAPMCSAGETAA